MRKDLKLRAMMYPMPAVIVSTYNDDGAPDGMTAAWCGICSHKPPCIMIAINSTLKRRTLVNIKQRNAFVVNVSDISHMTETDYLGIDSGYDVDKFDRVHFTALPSAHVNAPIIEQLPFSLECRAVQFTEVGSHTQIIGEIVNISAEDTILNEKGFVDIHKLDPVIYEDVLHDYYRIGEKCGDAFSAGVIYRKASEIKEGEGDLWKR